MIQIAKITRINNKKHIAILDTSSISFMQGLQVKGVKKATDKAVHIIF